jgi:hypothetical protein
MSAGNIDSLRSFVRKVIQEEIGRNYQSIRTMPMDFTRYPEVNVDVIADTTRDRWVVTIEVRDQEVAEKLGMTGVERRYFNAEDDARSYARVRADELRGKVMTATES